MDDDPVWYPLGGPENVFRLHSELPHKRPPESRVLRSAYRTGKGLSWPDTDIASANSSITGFPARSPTTHLPPQLPQKNKVSLSSRVYPFESNFALPSNSSSFTSRIKFKEPWTAVELDLPCSSHGHH